MHIVMTAKYEANFATPLHYRIAGTLYRLTVQVGVMTSIHTHTYRIHFACQSSNDAVLLCRSCHLGLVNTLEQMHCWTATVTMQVQ